MGSQGQESEAPEISDELLKQFDKEISGIDTSAVGEKVSEATAHATGPARDAIASLLTQALNKGLMPKTALRLGDDTMEAIYGQGYNLYNQGKYKEASYVFRLLMMLDYLTPKYSMGLAACLHRMKDYKNAANTYLLSATLDTSNPMPHYHAADCYMQLGVKIAAIFSLNLAIQAAGSQPQYSVIKERATLMRETLNQLVQEEWEKSRHK